MSVAAGELRVGALTQSDTEKADPEPGARAGLKERIRRPNTAELTAIYVARGLDEALARQVAQPLMAHDALGSHARDELGISGSMAARPLQAALASAASFAFGALLPLAVAAVAPRGARSGGCLEPLWYFWHPWARWPRGRAARRCLPGAAWRVTFWGALAMGVTAGVGALFGAAL